MNNTADIEGLMSTHIVIRDSSYPGQVIIMDKNHIAVWCALCSSCQDKMYKVRQGSGLQYPLWLCVPVIGEEGPDT